MESPCSSPEAWPHECGNPQIHRSRRPVAEDLKRTGMGCAEGICRRRSRLRILRCHHDQNWTASPSDAVGSRASEALQPDFGNVTSLEMMVHHPSSAPEVSATDVFDALFNESETTPSTTEAATKDTLTCLVDILKHVAEFDPTGETPLQLSAITPPVNDTMETLWLKLCGTSAENIENLENLSVTSEPTPSTPPPAPAPASVLTVQTGPGISVPCVYRSAQLMGALKELARILQTAATKKNKVLHQLINGFSEILEDCFKNVRVKYHN